MFAKKLSPTLDVRVVLADFGEVLRIDAVGPSRY